ncbi:MAG: sigma-54-dependent Fis family transcriptional regulator, partial [Gemmatimonadales bacterium]
MKVLVVDDDAGLRKTLSLILDDGGYEVILASDAETGLRMAREASPDFILTDVRMPGMDGLEFVERYKGEGGTATVLVMSAYGSMNLAMDAMKRGAYDYLHKPFGAEEVLLTLKKAEEREDLRREVGRLREEVAVQRRYGGIVAEAPAMTRVVDMARKVARHPTSVLIQGDTGTGKELVARLIHEESSRSGEAFVAVNCGAIPENLLESEFFGHVKGAFSGADRDREGLFDAAHGGTLFLDEVGDLPESLQVKLLRALQEGEIRRVGESANHDVDVRVIAASNRNLKEASVEGGFREDLYFRLAVVTLSLPSLRERPEDLPMLTRLLLERHAQRMGMEAPAITPEALECLARYPWPGNVRELENVLERAMVLVEEDGAITPAELPG